jgi:ankyrin repeat protein
MRENPDLDQLKRQAKELHEAYRAQQPDAIVEVGAHHRTATRDTFALHDAQFVLARSYGFESWPKLKAAVDGITAKRLHEAVESGDLSAARALLERRPEIVDQGRGEMRAIHMAVIRRDLAMTKLLLEFGADTDGGIWPNRDATSPYIIARDRGYTEIVDAIQDASVQRGLRGHNVPTEAKTKLERARQSGGEEAMIAVLDQHPELADVCSPEGCTMLHQIAGHGALKIIRWLIDHGAAVNAKWKRDYWHCEWTPLDFAASGWEGGWWNFDYAAFEATAKLLLEHGAELSPISAATLGRWDYLERCSKEKLEGQRALEGAVRGAHLDMLRRLLDLGLDPDERVRVGPISDQTWSAAGPLFHAVIQNRLDMARLLLERGADPNAQVWTSGSPAFRAYDLRNPEMIALIEKYGGWIDAGSAGYARQVEIARKMLAGEIEGHIEPNDFSGHTVAEQLLWGGASSLCAEIVRMALEHIDWAPGDPRWFWMLWRPVPGHEDYNEQQQVEACETFKLILARCGPNHRSQDYGQTMLHEVTARDHRVGAQLATILLDAGARLDVRDHLLKSTPFGWACRWGRVEIVKLLLARGADPVEPDAEPWATPHAWAEKMNRPEIIELLG